MLIPGPTTGIFLATGISGPYTNKSIIKVVGPCIARKFLNLPIKGFSVQTSFHLLGVVYLYNSAIILPSVLPSLYLVDKYASLNIVTSSANFCCDHTVNLVIAPPTNFDASPVA